MSSRRSLADWLVATAAGALFAAVALTVAVQLLKAIWVPLVGIACGVLIVVGLAAWYRAQSRGW